MSTIFIIYPILLWVVFSYIYILIDILIPFLTKGDLASPTNYRGITLTPIAAKTYNLMLLNGIRPKIDPLLRKNQNGFRTNISTYGKIQTIRRLLERVKSNNIPPVLLFVDFSKSFDSIDRKNMKYILKSYGISAETVSTIMMLYMNHSMVKSPDGDTQLFEITTGILQGDTISPFLFIICLDYILKSYIDCSSHFSFTLKIRRSRRHPSTYITDIKYAYDIAITADSMENIKQLLNQIEEKAKDIRLKIYMSFNQKEDQVLTK